MCVCVCVCVHVCKCVLYVCVTVCLRACVFVCTSRRGYIPVLVYEQYAATCGQRERPYCILYAGHTHTSSFRVRQSSHLRKRYAFRLPSKLLCQHQHVLAQLRTCMERDGCWHSALCTPSTTQCNTVNTWMSLANTVEVQKPVRWEGRTQLSRKTWPSDTHHQSFYRGKPCNHRAIRRVPQAWSPAITRFIRSHLRIGCHFSN